MVNILIISILLTINYLSHIWIAHANIVKIFNMILCQPTNESVFERFSSSGRNHNSQVLTWFVQMCRASWVNKKRSREQIINMKWKCFTVLHPHSTRRSPWRRGAFTTLALRGWTINHLCSYLDTSSCPDVVDISRLLNILLVAQDKEAFINICTKKLKFHIGLNLIL